jgi:transcriptional regulator with XRE-family HTH domain
MEMLKTLRENKGFSQEELSSRLGISRQTLVKYERAESTLPTNIIKKLSGLFDLDPGCFISGNLPQEPEYRIIAEDNSKQSKNDIRIDIPQKNISKFKEALLYILGKAGARPNVGQTVLYKLLYFIDFDYYELYEEQLIGALYIKNTFGPTPIDFAKIIKKMQTDNELEEIKTKHFNHDQTKYMPIRKANLQLFTAREIKHIDMVLEKHADKSAAELSALSHKDVPWITTEDKKVIPYEAVFYRTAETSVRQF